MLSEFLYFLDTENHKNIFQVSGILLRAIKHNVYSETLERPVESDRRCSNFRGDLMIYSKRFLLVYNNDVLANCFAG